MPSTQTLDATDIAYLRELASRHTERALSEANQARIAAWKRHNDLQGGRPLVCISPEGSWCELGANIDQRYEPGHPAHGLEWWLLQQAYAWDHFQEDWPLWPSIRPEPVLQHSGWGLQAEWTHSSSARGARRFAPVLRDEEDFDRLCPSTVSYDAEATAARLAWHQEIFDGTLLVQDSGIGHISFHIMQWYSALRGLEELMMDMMEEPELLHRACRLYTDAQHRKIDQFEQWGLLLANSDNTYHNSGGNSWSDTFPAADLSGAASMWASAESQELAQVGPTQHREFALAYEAELLNRFGRSGYGCCEDLTAKLPDLFELVPNIHRISISPWADVEACARQLAGRRAIFSWKPQPAHLVGKFNEDRIRAYIANTVRVCNDHDCQLEIILKDTHTCEHQPERFDRWSRCCQEAIDSVWA
ncbi:MAG: hypothetical protein ACOCXA_07610 [Planctomycetota bacterium]